MTTELIALTGVTGQIGGRVAGHLATTDHPLRLVARDTDRCPEIPHAEVVAGSYDDQDAMTRALQGADVFFMVSAIPIETSISCPDGRLPRADHR